MKQKIDKHISELVQSREVQMKRYNEVVNDLVRRLHQLSSIPKEISSLKNFRLPDGFRNNKEKVEILLSQIPKVKDDRVRSDYITVLTQPFNLGIDDSIIEFLLSYFDDTINDSDNPETKASITRVLELGYKKKYFDKVTEYLDSDIFSTNARLNLIATLGKSKQPEALGYLLRILEGNRDEDIQITIHSLGKIGDSKVIPLIEPFIESEKEWVVQESVKAIAKLNKR
jgi:hypothetical protein